MAAGALEEAGVPVGLVVCSAHWDDYIEAFADRVVTCSVVFYADRAEAESMPPGVLTVEVACICVCLVIGPAQWVCCSAAAVAWEDGALSIAVDKDGWETVLHVVVAGAVEHALVGVRAAVGAADRVVDTGAGATTTAIIVRV